MTEATPEDDPQNYKDGFWRCGRADNCGLAAGWGTDHKGVGACKLHGGNAGAPEDNQNAKTHGAFSEHFRSDLTDPEQQALDALVDHLESITDERTIAAEIAAEALLKYKRSADSRFLREARQWFSDFNLLPNEDEINVGGEGMNPLQVVVSREQYDGDE